MKYLIQLAYLALCVGLCLLSSYLMPDLFAPGNYIGVAIVAGIAFVWFYGNKLVLQWYLRFSGKEAKSPLDKNKL